ncbi:MAG: hypothetical protein ACI4WG_00455 [Erysipelotrichaceae bacterium]
MKKYTEIVFILDRSGSMSGLEKDTIGGYNSTIEKQKKESGSAVVSTILFNHYSKVVCNRVDINKVKPMTEDDYRVGGSTALLDAVGGAIVHVEKVHKMLGEAHSPEKTIFIITTDGYENSSKEFSYQKVKSLISKHDDYQFIFMGANIDAYQMASSMGIARETTVNYRCDSTGQRLCFASINNAIGDIRKNGKIQSDNWRDESDQYYNKK